MLWFYFNYTLTRSNPHSVQIHPQFPECCSMGGSNCHGQLPTAYHTLQPPVRLFLLDAPS